MSADSVEREILIEASPEIVWGVITEPAQISRWLSDEAEVEVHAGADGTLRGSPEAGAETRNSMESFRFGSWTLSRFAASHFAGAIRRARHRMRATQR